MTSPGQLRPACQHTNLARAQPSGLVATRNNVIQHRALLGNGAGALKSIPVTCIGLVALIAQRCNG